MKAQMIMLAPIAFAGVSYLLWLGYQEGRWKRGFSNLIIRTTQIATALYVLSYAASMIGDRIH